MVAYEADSIDSESRLGWSVIVVGTARLLTDDVATTRYRARLKPRISGVVDDVITISADLVTGYEIVLHVHEFAVGRPYRPDNLRCR